MKGLLVIVVFLMTVSAAFSHTFHLSDIPAPRGYRAFCERLPHECLSSRGSVETKNGAVVNSEERLAELVEVNRSVNHGIQSITDKQQYRVEEYWTIDVTRGDCEEYVLEKRQRLIDLGWPSSSLLIATGISRGEGHAVLLVVMSHGVFVLDNLTDKIHSVHTTKVKLATAQKPEDPRKWAVIRVNENIQ